MRKKTVRYLGLGLLALCLSAQAIYAATLADAQAAKATAKQYKDGCDQWSGLFDQHEFDATVKYYEAWAKYEDCLDAQLFEVGSAEDASFHAMMAAGGDVEAEDYGNFGSPWRLAKERRVNGDICKSSAANFYAQGGAWMLRQQYDQAVSDFNEAAKPPPALRFQKASDHYAHGIDHADAAKAKWQEAWDFLHAIQNP